MSDTNHRTWVEVKSEVHLVLTEQEARAFDAIFGYGVEAFLKAFYRELGKHYVQPHEAGVRSLHHRVRGMVTPALNEIDKTRKALHEVIGKRNCL